MKPRAVIKRPYSTYRRYLGSTKRKWRGEKKVEGLPKIPGALLTGVGAFIWENEQSASGMTVNRPRFEASKSDGISTNATRVEELGKASAAEDPVQEPGTCQSMNGSANRMNSNNMSHSSDTFLQREASQLKSTILQLAYKGIAQVGITPISLNKVNKSSAQQKTS
ncbi:hypothetical protein K432DRAFT_398029 [Lepidopterella palustris CBS 459.81]|uniref:Uncharacterized protein n=1 Tax=Lepidopterella palustris CBS 459.81 TaxID=1314670 RepID=A0A8E2DZS5_9PEZI|nr:hypothetical protein K432DRAFT_398029 [Lepidopterella palustris CBS 459.81]